MGAYCLAASAETARRVRGESCTYGTQVRRQAGAHRSGGHILLLRRRNLHTPALRLAEYFRQRSLCAPRCGLSTMPDAMCEHSLCRTLLLSCKPGASHIGGNLSRCRILNLHGSTRDSFDLIRAKRRHSIPPQVDRLPSDAKGFGQLFDSVGLVAVSGKIFDHGLLVHAATIANKRRFVKTILDSLSKRPYTEPTLTNSPRRET